MRATYKFLAHCEVSHIMLMPIDKLASDREKPKYRLLYVGRDAEWFRRLKSVLGLPANRLVFCPGDSVKYFLRSDIRYDLFLFDLDLLNETSPELVRLARSLFHRQHTPTIVVGSEEVIDRFKELVCDAGADECLIKTSDVSVAVETIRRLELIRSERTSFNLHRKEI